MLKHGGNLQQALRDYPDVREPWLDLSTGISPWSWPVPEVPTNIWQRLPEVSPQFNRAVEYYYGANDLIAIAGSQVAIELIPQLLPISRVAIPRWGYGEHINAWQKAKHHVVLYDSYEGLVELLAEVEHAVVINPNNPTGECWSRKQLEDLDQQIKGHLIVDEAFIDSLKTDCSMLQSSSKTSTIVLRSLGKFFGLAGVRLGFISLPKALRKRFNERLTLWSISSPTLWVAEQALIDTGWQQAQRERIAVMKEKLQQLLGELFEGAQFNSGPLFISIYGQVNELKPYFKHFAKQGIWLRLFANPNDKDHSYLRFGFPENEHRLAAAIEAIKKQ